jgi:ABC-2 type transport system ATP-binding protein
MNNEAQQLVVEVEGLCKRFDEFALKDVSFSLPQGFVMGFMGPNGAGKTTTIKSILGMLNTEAGNVRLFGRDINSLPPGQKERIGIVLDAPFFVRAWDLSEVERAVSGFYANWSRETYAALLKRFGLNPKKKVKELSRGMQMKLMIAVALSHEAELLILDEPTSGLDPVARDELTDILRAFISDGKKSVLFSTHITQDLEKVADYITFIRNGEIMFTGEKDELTDSYVMVKGGPGELDAGLRGRLIGCREYPAGFEALARRQDLTSLPNGVRAERANLDDIFIFLTGGGRNAEVEKAV